MPQGELGSEDSQREAMGFILMLGLVSLFGDIAYEGARAVAGPYLAILGASAVAVGSVAGLGEFAAYALRLGSGYMADKTGRYWPLAIAGYGLILSIPLLAMAESWQYAAALLILERLGKAIRSPARDTMLSYATKRVGRGWGFGIHEALDQVGAILGPLALFAALSLGIGYRWGFALLIAPVALALAILLTARTKVPSPERLEAQSEVAGAITVEARLPKAFWLYALFTFLSVAGFANFQLISYHLKVRLIVPEGQIPALYAIAMGIDALIALAAGRAYDRIGFASLMAIPLLTIPMPILAFSNGYGPAVAAIMLWGIVMGIHETTMRAAIADLTPAKRRGSAYGIFNSVYGLSWLFGGALMGLLYERSIAVLMAFAILMELASVPAILLVGRAIRKGLDGPGRVI
ncbi:MAG: MFS transporter [Candidatus Bathyarchaeia archaeon]